MTDISKGFQRLTPRIIFTQWFLLNKRDSHWGSLPWSLMLHIWDYVYIYTYIYIDILHVNLKCYLLTNICQMVILKHRKYLFSIWFSAFFGVVPCIYIYIFYISICSADRNRATMLSSDRTRDDCANSRLPGPGWWAYTAKYQCGSIMFDIYIYV
jgi:hypothetical protein